MFKLTQKNTQAILGNTGKGKLQGDWPARDCPTFYKELHGVSRVGLVCGQPRRTGEQAQKQTWAQTESLSDHEVRDGTVKQFNEARTTGKPSEHHTRAMRDKKVHRVRELNVRNETR